MDSLTDILEMLQHAVTNDDGRCAMVSDGTPHEASLYGTRDGLLNLAIGIVRFVAECDSCLTGNGSSSDHPVEELADQEAMWGDELKRALYQLPGGHPYLVGCYLFKNSRALLKALEEAVRVDLPEGASLANDPEFKKLL